MALAIHDGHKMYDEDRRKVSTDGHIVDEDWIKSVLQSQGHDDSVIDTRIDTTQHVADMIDIQLPAGETLFPHYQVSDEMKELYEEFCQK
jgi:DNA polymerase III alpha subunit